MIDKAKVDQSFSFLKAASEERGLTGHRSVDESFFENWVSRSLGFVARYGVLHRFVYAKQSAMQNKESCSTDLRQYLSFGSPPFPLESFVIKTRTLSKSASPFTSAHCSAKVRKTKAKICQTVRLRIMEFLAAVRLFTYSTLQPDGRSSSVHVAHV